MSMEQGLPADEKDRNAAINSHPIEVPKVGEEEGCALDVEKHRGPGPRPETAADGHTVLIPQPSDDTNDPLNWSRFKKGYHLAIIAYLAFLPDFGSSIGISALIPQAKQWGLPENTVQHNLVGNLFCLGAGGVFVIALANYFGRLPVLFYFQTMSFATGIWIASSTEFDPYLGARICNGFFATTAQAGGLMWIKDLFFFHQHPRAINAWSSGIIVSPYIGPMVESFIVWKREWPDGFWIYTGLNGLGLILIVAFLDETYYNRNITASGQPSRRSRLLRLLGVEQLPQRRVYCSFVQAWKRPGLAILKVPVIFCVLYYFLNFAWTIGINATVSVWLTEYYAFTPRDLGIFFIAGIIGALVGWLIGHLAVDSIGSIWSRRHAGRVDPEARLVITYLSALLIAVSLVIIGLALTNRWHYMLVAVFYGVEVAGIMLATVGLDSYLLDAYPEASGEVGAWINVARSFGGFMATFVQLEWVERAGSPAVTLGVQAATVVAACLLVVGLQSPWGRKVRLQQGAVEFSD